MAYVAADISTSRLTPEAVEALISAGVECMIVGVREDDYPLTMHNLELAHLFPRRPDIYVYPCWSRPVRRRIRRAIDTFRDGFDRLWVNFEDNGDGEPGVPYQAPETVIRLGDQAFAVCDAEGVLSGYYGAPWWHVPSTDNYTGWSDRALWVADHDGIADLDDWIPFGGWTQLAAKQYEANVKIGGVNVDLSIMQDV